RRGIVFDGEPVFLNGLVCELRALINGDEFLIHVRQSVVVVSGGAIRRFLGWSLRGIGRRGRSRRRSFFLRVTGGSRLRSGQRGSQQYRKSCLMNLHVIPSGRQTKPPMLDAACLRQVSLYFTLEWCQNAQLTGVTK